LRTLPHAVARLVLSSRSVIRRNPDSQDFLAPALRHEIACADRSALLAAYTRVSDAPWIESCSVDLPNLRLVLRVSEAAMHPCDLTVRWLQRVERVAQGL